MKNFKNATSTTPTGSDETSSSGFQASGSKQVRMSPPVAPDYDATWSETATVTRWSNFEAG